MSALPVVTRRRMEANREYFEGGYQPDMVALIERHGLNAKYVTWVEYDVYDTALLRFATYVRDDREGRTVRLQCEVDGVHDHDRIGKHDDCLADIAIEPVERALVGDLPEWWQPEADQ